MWIYRNSGRNEKLWWLFSSSQVAFVTSSKRDKADVKCAWDVWDVEWVALDETTAIAAQAASLGRSIYRKKSDMTERIGKLFV